MYIKSLYMQLFFIFTDAVCAIKMNVKENNVKVLVDSGNLIGQQNPDWSTIILGDMFYDCDIRDELVDWLIRHRQTFKSRVFIGDPGRLPLAESNLQGKLKKMAAYELPETCARENNGHTKGYVWQLCGT